jgi:hypothetical protein
MDRSLTPSRERRWWALGPVAGVQLLIVALAALGSLYLRWQVPVILNSSGADGLLFVRNASTIGAGEWLGDYGRFTLVKGPGYPIFIAGTNFLGIPLKLGEQLVYLAAAAAVAWILLITLRRAWVATAAFVVLALTPASFGWGGADMLRDSLYASLGLLTVALAFLTTLGVVRRSHWFWVVSGALLTGITAAFFWLTREEGVTLLPTLGCIVLGVPLLTWWSRRGNRAARPDAAPQKGSVRWRAALALALATLTMVAPLVAVRAENAARYGVALGNDMAEGAFLRAYADWSRVEAGSRQYRIPITEAQREAVYEVSPAARELRSVLESPDNGWRSFACQGGFCDYGGGWMVWALRDAAADAGHFRDAASVQRYFARLSEEITAACDSGELTCAPRLPASLQPIQRAPAGELASRYAELAGRLVTGWGLYDTPDGGDGVPAEVRAEYDGVIDGIPPTPAAAATQMAAFTANDEPYEVLAAVYRVLVPLLVLIAVCGVAIGLVRAARRRGEVSPLLVLAVALAVGVAVRLFLLALIDTAEYDLLNSPRYPLPGYQLPGYVFLLAFGVVGTALALVGLRPARYAVDGRPDDVRPSESASGEGASQVERAGDSRDTEHQDAGALPDRR